VFEASELPTTDLMASVGNGYLATTVYSPTIYVSGVFNGRNTSSPSHRARIPSPCDISVRSNIPRDSTTNLYRLNVSEGVFHYYQTADKFQLEQKIYAHRVLEHVIVSELSVTNDREDDVAIVLDTRFNPKATSDIDFKIYTESVNDYKAMIGYIKEPEEPDSARIGVAVVWSDVPGPTTIPKKSSKKWYFVTAVASSLDAQDFLHGAYNAYEEALRDPEGLLDSHVTAWEKLWGEGRVDMKGNLPLAQAVYGSLYYILSSIRESWPYGLSPGGLASDGYYGHTFWDQETWMYPPVLILYPGLARSCLEYRVDRLAAAKERAAQRGYKGAMFPWESAVTGHEVCPGQVYADFEQHITGDIGFAAKQYYIATHDQAWLNDPGQRLIYGTAEFWASRAVFDESRDAYVINHVMPPDEYRSNVDNSVYTNVIAKLNLEFAASVLQDVPANWSRIAEKMFIPFDTKRQYHPEYEGYDLTEVKQADTILLGYPLMYPMSKDIRRNDLNVYEPRTDPDGPAMTKSMFAVNWLDIGETKKAEDSFNKSYLNVEEPFKVWTETPGGGAVNFITGAGGFLQAVLSGYTGLKLTEKHLEFNPRLLPATSEVRVTGVNYLGNSFNVVVGRESSDVTVTSRESSAPSLEAVVKSTGQRHMLKVGDAVSL
ncbi:predicted protein, partial [Nematostella vectensis]